MVYGLLILGLLMLVYGADTLVDASVAIAKKAKVPDFIIGLTIIGIGTSAPELFVSVSSALKGMGDVAIGNVVGSNIANIMLILGAAALIHPISMQSTKMSRDIFGGILVAALLAGLCYLPRLWGGQPGLCWWQGLIMLCVFAGYFYLVFADGKKKSAEPSKPTARKDEDYRFANLSMWLLPIIALVALAVMLWGGNMFVDSAVEIAKRLGMSEAVIAITIIAIGTSLPELITCIIAASKGNSALALGNVIGSNIFNVLLILGASSLISPLAIGGIKVLDFSVMIGSASLLCLWYYTGKREKDSLGKKYGYIDRWEGGIFLLLYIAYIVWLLIR